MLAKRRHSLSLHGKEVDKIYETETLICLNALTEYCVRASLGPLESNPCALAPLNRNKVNCAGRAAMLTANPIFEREGAIFPRVLLE